MIIPDYRSYSYRNELYHFGIPRRSGRYPWGSGRRPFQGDDKKAIKEALTGKSRSDKFTQERTIAKGTKMYRTSTSSNSDLEKGQPAYVSYLDVDRNLYKGGYIRTRDRKDTSYEYEMTLDEDLKIPSRETLKKTMAKVIDENPKLLKESVNSYLEELIPKYTWDYYEIIYDPNTGQYDKSRWHDFVADSYNRRKDVPVEEQWGSIALSLGKADKLKNAIIDDLKQQGYNAITDEAGVGGGDRVAEGIDPLIVFDSDVLKIDKIKPISRTNESKSYKDYNEWARKSRQSDNW